MSNFFQIAFLEVMTYEQALMPKICQTVNRIL